MAHDSNHHVEFRGACLATGMSVIIEAHMVWCGIPQMQELDVHPYQKYGVLFFDEDWAECIHKDFDSIWQNFSCTYTGTERTAHRILRCMSRYCHQHTYLT